MTAKWIAILLLASPAGIAAAQQQPAPAKPDQQQTQDQSQNGSKDKDKDKDKDSDRQDSLAAAARQAREQQKTQPRTPRVWDNDNLPTAAEGVSVVGTPGAGSADQSTSSAAASQEGNGPAKAESTTDRKGLQKELEDARARLKSAKTDLDIATRTYQLDQQSFYSNPNYQSDAQGAEKLKNEQSDIDTKKQEVDDAEKKVEELKSKLQDLEKKATNPAAKPQ